MSLVESSKGRIRYVPGRSAVQFIGCGDVIIGHIQVSRAEAEALTVALEAEH